jgi:spore germination protein GerM
VIYAIVNTLNSLPTVEKTLITVEGKPLDTLGGHVEIEGPLESDEELVVAR